jgi:hypothetical protein
MSLWLLGPIGGKVGKVGKGTCVQCQGGLSDLCDLPALRPERRNRGDHKNGCPRDKKRVALRFRNMMPALITVSIPIRE